MAGRWFPILFTGVPNLTIVPLNFEHDGDFVHPPNPLVPSNLEQLRNAVRDNQADFGACFDGDADRCVFVDNNARIVRSDLVTALLAEEQLRDRPGSTVVYDLRSSRIVPEIIEKLSAELRKLSQDPEVQKRIHLEGGDPLTSTAAEYAADIDREEKKWGALVRQLNLKVE